MQENAQFLLKNLTFCVTKFAYSNFLLYLCSGFLKIPLLRIESDAIRQHSQPFSYFRPKTRAKQKAEVRLC